jgi:hypothetical protein
MVTESDVSHQSSFYEIPKERKLKLHTQSPLVQASQKPQTQLRLQNKGELN